MLPTLDGQTWGHPYDVNASGKILGDVRTQTGWLTLLWTDGVIAELRLPADWGNTQTNHWRINTAGDIGASGSMLHTPENPWENVQHFWRAFLLRNGSADVLDPLTGYEHSGANAINDQGWVAGSSWNGEIWSDARTATLWIDGVAIEISGLAGVMDMNNAGAVIGVGTDWNTYVYRNGAVTPLTVPGAINVQAWAINEAGQIVITSWVSGVYASYVWHDGALTPILGPPGTEGWHVEATSINNAGVAVATAWSGSQWVSFLWQNGSAAALPAADGYDAWAWRISDSGVIIGEMYPHDGSFFSAAAAWYPSTSQYAFGGFLRPIDNPPVINRMRAGAAVPVKFSLGGDQGMEILAGTPQSVHMACDNAAQIDSVEETSSAGSSGLSYDAELGVYTYVWKTERSWAGTCRRFSLALHDGSVHHAIFSLSR
jgi:uncharacterized membrane protein